MKRSVPLSCAAVLELNRAHDHLRCLFALACPAVFGTVVYLYGGWVFLAGGIRALRDRLPGMMMLISLAISVAFGDGVTDAPALLTANVAIAIGAGTEKPMSAFGAILFDRPSLH